MSDDRPALTLTEAAKATRVSRKTLRRRLDSDEFPNARRLDGPTGTGPWVVPIADLLSAGFTLHSPDDDQGDEDESDDHGDEDESDDHGDDLRIRELEHELELERERRQVADALRVAAERNADDLRTALRMLEAGPQPARHPGSSVSEPTLVTPEQRPGSSKSEPMLVTNTDARWGREPDSPTSQRPTITSRLRAKLRGF